MSQIALETAPVGTTNSSRSNQREPLRVGDVLVFKERECVYLVVRFEPDRAAFSMRTPPHVKKRALMAPRLLNLETGDTFLWFGSLGGYMHRL